MHSVYSYRNRRHW